MAVDLARVRKTVVAVLGVAVIVAGSLGFTAAEGADSAVIGVFDSVVAVLMALGVYAVPNDHSV